MRGLTACKAEINSATKEVEHRAQEGMGLWGQVVEQFHGVLELCSRGQNTLKTGQYYQVFPFPSCSPKAL